MTTKKLPPSALEPVSLLTVFAWLAFVVCAAIAYQLRHLDRWPQSLWETVLLTVGLCFAVGVLLADAQWGWRYYIDENTKNGLLVTRSLPLIVSIIFAHFFALTSTASPLAVGMSWGLLCGLWLEIWIHHTDPQWLFARLGIADIQLSSNQWNLVWGVSWSLVLLLSVLVLL